MFKSNYLLSLFFVMCLAIVAGCEDGASQDPEITSQVNAMLAQGSGGLGFSCDETGDGKMKCVCIKGAISLPWSCNGIDKMCKILGGKKKCRDDGWCECIQGIQLNP